MTIVLVFDSSAHQKNTLSVGETHKQTQVHSHANERELHAPSVCVKAFALLMCPIIVEYTDALPIPTVPPAPATTTTSVALWRTMDAAFTLCNTTRVMSPPLPICEPLMVTVSPPATVPKLGVTDVIAAVRRHS